MDSKWPIDKLIAAIVAGTIAGIFVLLVLGIPVPGQLYEGVVFAGLAALFRAAN